MVHYCWCLLYVATILGRVFYKITTIVVDAHDMLMFLVLMVCCFSYYTNATDGYVTATIWWCSDMLLLSCHGDFVFVSLG